MTNYLIIGLGGFFGAIARYVVSLWVGQNWGRIFPLGTFIVNISGCFLISLLMSLFTERFMVNPQVRLFLVIGFLGAYTTFSTFEYETGNLVRDGEWSIISKYNLKRHCGFVALKFGEFIAKSI
jgi:CrcB protein